METTTGFDAGVERALLGCLLLSPELFDDVACLVDPQDFYVDRHRWIWEAIAKLRDEGAGVDTALVRSKLRAAKRVVDDVELMSLSESAIPTIANAESHAKRVADLAMVRRVVSAARDITAQGQREVADAEAFIDLAETTLMRATTQRLSAGDIPDYNAIVPAAVAEVEALANRGGGMLGVPTGLRALDTLTLGIQPGHLWILAARPSMGKSCLAGNIALQVAKSGRPVVVFSLEMSRLEWVKRNLVAESGIDGQRFRSGRISQDDVERVKLAGQAIQSLPLYLDDKAGINVLWLRRAARRLQRRHADQLGLIVVDYLQLMRSVGETREQEVGDISRSLKEIAKELNCGVLALSQLNRGVESRSDKRPLLSDLRESGSLEQDADVIVFIYRDEVYNKKTDDKGIAELIVGKQRSGPTGTVRCAFRREHMAFNNLQQAFDEPDPQQGWGY